MFKAFKVWSILHIILLVVLALSWGVVTQGVLSALDAAGAASAGFPMDAINTIMKSYQVILFICAALILLSFILCCALSGKGKVNKGVLVPALLASIANLPITLIMMIVTIVAMSRTSRQHPAPSRKPASRAPSSPRRNNDGFGDDDPIPADYGLEEETPRRRGRDEFGDDDPIPADYGLEEETPRRRGGEEEFGDDEPIPADYGLDEETPRRRGGDEEFGDDEPIPADYGIVGEEEEETPRRRRPSDDEFGDDDPIPADYGLND